MDKAYSLIRLTKAVEEGEQRIIEGIATTPTTDRVGDIVDPMGAHFADEVQLHLYHDSTLPVGKVKFGRPTKKGIPFKARIPMVHEAGTVRDRVDEAWHSLKYGLIGAVSIGFRVMWELKEAATEVVEFLESGGVKFLKTELLELSLVSIPANPDAVITGIKSIDKELRATLGQRNSAQLPVVRLAQITKSAVVTAQEKTHRGNGMKLRDSIQSFGNKRASLVAAMTALMETAEKEGRTLNAEEADQYAGHEAEIKSVDEHLARLENFERVQATKAAPVVIDEDDPEDSGRKARAPHITVVEREKKLPPGIEFARYVMCLGAAKGNIPMALEIAKNRFPENRTIVNVLKSAVAAGTTTDATWAGPLLEYTQFAGDFLEFLRPQTILGKFGQGGIPSLRRVPFNINIRGQTSGGSGYWVGQGRPKPLTKFDFNNTYLGFTKVAAIAVLTEELLRFSNPSAEALVRDALVAALVELLDQDFVDPANAGSANISPASITNGVTPIPSSGTDADAVRADVKAIFGEFIANNISLASAVWIMPNTVALSLSMLVNALGQSEFPGLTMSGGTFAGLPVIASEYLDSASDGQNVILASAQDIWLADDDIVTIDASREASLQMDDAPTNRSDNGTGASMVSMFQTDSVALRAERYVNWKKRRAAAVQLLTEVEWGAGS